MHHANVEGLAKMWSKHTERSNKMCISRVWIYIFKPI